MARSIRNRSQAWAATITAERESAQQRVAPLNPDKFAQADRALLPKSTLSAIPRAVRETFTMLVEEREGLLEMKRRAVRAGFELNKSDIARMALAALRRLSNEEFSAMARELKKLKPGKPTHSQSVA
jgi:hypothetical protein